MTKNKQKACYTLHAHIQTLIQDTGTTQEKNEAGYEKALPLCEQLLQLSPHKQEYINLYVRICDVLKKTENIYTMYRNIISLEPANIAHYDNAIEALLSVGRETEVPSLMAESACQLMRKQLYEKALAAYDSIIELFPQAAPLYKEDRKRCIDTLINILSEKIQNDPENEKLYKKRAELHNKIGDDNAARKDRYKYYLIKSNPKLPLETFLARCNAIDADLQSCNDHFSTSDTPSIAAMLYSRMSVLHPKSAQEAKKTFQILACSPLLHPIAEFAALDKKLLFFSEMTYNDHTTLSEFHPTCRTITFGEHPLADNAIHELCHFAEDKLRIIESNYDLLTELRENDEVHFAFLSDLLSSENDAKEIYTLVINGSNIYEEININEENIVRIAEAILLYGEEKVRETLPHLCEFFTDTFLPAIIKAVGERKEKLARKAADFVASQVFVPEADEVFGTEGKALEKKGYLQTSIITDIIESRKTNPDAVYNFSCRHLYHHVKPVKNFVQALKSELERDGTLYHKPGKDTQTGHRYISIDRNKLSHCRKRKIDDLLEEHFATRNTRRRTTYSRDTAEPIQPGNSRSL